MAVPRLVIQAVTNAVLHASGFSPLHGDAHPLVTGSVSALRDYCHLDPNQSSAGLVLGTSVLGRPSIGILSSTEKPVAHFVVLPDFHEDEAVFREAFGHLGRAPSAERHLLIGVGRGGP